MIFKIEREPLLDALQRLQSAVEKRNTVQVLGNILCIAKGQELSVCATDLEVGVKIILPAQIEQEGKVTLSAKHFLDIVKELPSQPLQITRKENNWVEFLCGKSRFNIVSIPADEYPALPNFEEKNYYEARTESLIQMIDRTEFAVSTDATRYHLNGVYFEHLDNGIMRMTATDGHRLSFVDQEVFLTMPDLKRGIILPKKGLNELRKIISSGETTVGLAFERGYVFAKMNGWYLFIRLIDAEYPDYRLVIPKSTDRVVRMDLAIFNSALKRVSLLAHEKSRGIKLAFQPGVLTISSSNPDMGEAREEVDCEYDAEPLEIGFNSKYLLECLDVVHSEKKVAEKKVEKLELHLKDRLSPGILKCVGVQNHTYVIMPMRI